MDLLGQYADDDEPQVAVVTPKTTSIISAPNVVVSDRRINNIQVINPHAKELHYNAKISELYGPIVGPENPHKGLNTIHEGIGGTGVNSNLTGYVESYHMNKYMFDRNFYQEDQKSNEDKKRSKLKRKKAEQYQGPWAQFEVDDTNEEIMQGFTEEAFIEVSANDETNILAQQELEAEKLENVQKLEEENMKKRRKVEEEVQSGEPRSEYHLIEERDYQGRSFITPPSDLKPISSYRDARCYVPKHVVHTWKAHEKGSTSIEFFPKYGHLLLSTGMDGVAKIWDVNSHRKCVRTYKGHSKAIRMGSFREDGLTFATAGYDKMVRLWDTETGKVINTFEHQAIPYVVRIHPGEGRGHELLIGCSNKKVYAWDSRSNKVLQKYDRHLGPINTITFIDSNRRFVTSSDDKTLRVWEYGIPVEVKYVADPSMHSMPYVAAHPNGKWLIAQSLDNNILVYETSKGFRQHKSKKFSGHTISGYAVQCGFSNDARYVLSGDSEGNVNFWDWKSMERTKIMKAHDGVCIGAAWHPVHKSTIASCGWDGTVKLLE